jgi:hypothetical protein
MQARIIKEGPARSRGSPPMVRLTVNAKALAILLIVFIFCDFLLSPLGFETRGSAILGNPASLPWFGLLVGGLILNIASLILLSFRARVSSILALLGSSIYIVVLLGDQAGLVTPVKAPPLIAYVEIPTFLILLVTLFYASRVYRESRAKLAVR